MTKPVRLLKEEPLLNIASYARAGRPADRLTPAQVEYIRRTVNRAPEVVVKVLPRGSNDLKAVGKHIDYIGRKGRLDLEGDDGERLWGRVGNTLLEDWDLDIDAVRRQGNLAAARGRKPPKLVHKLMFSMPPGTPPQKVLSAVRKFAREEFYGQHRYALVLHTDEPHPHVHLVLKAVSEQGVRLNIKKANLRHWRSEFARSLRLLGVEANATERAVRGENSKALKDGIYRARLRGDSTYVRAQTEKVAAELLHGKLRVDQGKARMVDTRKKIESGWRAAGDILISQGGAELAEQIHRFLGQLPAPQTQNEQLAVGLLKRAREPRIPEKAATQ